MSQTPHTLTDYELELQSLRGAALEMGRLALEMMDSVGRMLRQEERADSARALAAERELDVNEVRLDSQASLILLRYQPVAVDLREVTTALRLSREFEQIGDDTRRLLASQQALLPWLATDAEDLLQKLWATCRRALASALDAFACHDAELARRIHESRKQVHEDSEATLLRIAHKVESSRDLAASYLGAVGAVTCLERIGAATEHIAAAVIFVETAEDVRHS